MGNKAQMKNEEAFPSITTQINIRENGHLLLPLTITERKLAS